MPTLHPTAIVDGTASVLDDAKIGPLSKVKHSATVHGPARLLRSTIQGCASILGKTEIIDSIVEGYSKIGPNCYVKDSKIEGHATITGSVNVADCVVRRHVHLESISGRLSTLIFGSILEGDIHIVFPDSSSVMYVHWWRDVP